MGAAYPHESDSLFEIIIAEGCTSFQQWRMETSSVSSQPWIWVFNIHSDPPEQGWKIHISAGIPTAEEILRRALPILLREVTRFKVIDSLRSLKYLNQGDAGLSQIGKFITIYPDDEAQAVRLAVSLDEATRGLRGPRILSDRRLAPGSLVHYRYGAFGNQRIQTRMGSISPAITTPDGDLVPDLHTPFYHVPDWAIDPFVEDGMIAEPERSDPLVGDRYIIVSTLYRSPKGEVYLAIDTDSPRRCVLKRAWRDALLGEDGEDACDRLRNEASVLRCLTADSRFPTVFDMIEHQGDLYMVMEDMDGKSLASYVSELAQNGQRVPSRQSAAWARELAAMIATIHGKGFIYRDLKSTNIVVTPSGRLRLLDFELTWNTAGGAPPVGFGTRGYMSPQQIAGESPSVADDLYGIGALLYFVTTGAEPSTAPAPSYLLRRPVELMNPLVSRQMASVITRCLAREPADRFPSAEALSAALESDTFVVSLSSHAHSQAKCQRDLLPRYLELARQIGESLLRRKPTSEPIASPMGAAGQTHSTLYRDASSGGAGIVLALAEFAARFEEPRYREVLRTWVDWLEAEPAVGGQPLPGLYVGEAGVAAALLRAGQALADPNLINRCSEKSQWVASLPYDSPDIFHGAAGRLRFHLLLWQQTSDVRDLGNAVEAGEWIKAAAERTAGGGIYWTIPPGFESLSGYAYLGYAHGAAGIADALLDLYQATGDEQFRRVAVGAAKWLATLPVSTLEDRTGLNWPTIEGGGSIGSFWCHGATGVGRFFLHASQLGVMAEAASLAERAARTVAYGARWAGPSRCHGLAGNIEFLLDMAEVTGESSYIREAHSLAELLVRSVAKLGGPHQWMSESPVEYSSEYMVGDAGVGMCLLRLGGLGSPMI